MTSLDLCDLQEIGCQACRHREQAHSYSGLGTTSKIRSGCQAAFASKLAPTEKQDQKIAAFGSSYTMSVSSSAFDLDPRATSEG
jgi:hypothetical protein